MTHKVMGRERRRRYLEFLSVPVAKYLGFPKINNIMYYPARVPASASRCVTLAAIASGDAGPTDLLKAAGFDNLRGESARAGKLLTLSMVDPDRMATAKLLDREPKEYVVADPMAGGGSIPLEAKRLGFTVIAGDCNPVAFLLLRATVEFPAKYGARLYSMVREEAGRLLDHVEKEVGKYYLDRAYIMVPSAEHECGAVIPIVREAALMRGRVYAVWTKDAGSGRVTFKISNRPGPPLNVCPFCGRPVSVEILRRRWVRGHKDVIDRLLQGDGSAADVVPDYYTVLAASVTKAKYREPSEQDMVKLVEAARELAAAAREGSAAECLPVFEIPADNEVFREIREAGLDFWHYLFTPRQLLFLYKVASYVRRRASELRRDHGELGAAVALYLALGMAKALNYSTLLAQWHSSKGVIRDLVGSQYALSKRVRLGFDFVDGNPAFTLRWAFEAEGGEGTSGGILPVLKLLCESLGGLWYEGRDAIYLWDAREVDGILPPGSVDLVNVDPPYYEQHDYAGIAELFWVLLQTALRDVLDVLFPTKRVRLDWSPYDPVVPRSVEMKGPPPNVEGGVCRFGEDFKRFLDACARVIRPGGLLVVWYSYGKLSGWEELFYRFYEAGYAVTKVWQVWTQSPQRRVALHTKAFFTSLVIVARPRARRELILDVDDARLEAEVSRRVRDSLLFILGTYGVEYLKEALVTSIADGLAGVTLFDLPRGSPMMDRPLYRRMLDKALETSVNTVIRELLARVCGRIPEVPLDAESRLYLALLLASTRDPRSGRLRVPHDFANRVSQVLGVPLHAVTVGGRGTGGGAADELLSPRDISGGGHQISRAIDLVYRLAEAVRGAGVRSAEEYAKEYASHAPLALAVASLAWEKLGLHDADLEKAVKEVLLKVVR